MVSSEKSRCLCGCGQEVSAKTQKRHLDGHAVPHVRALQALRHGVRKIQKKTQKILNSVKHAPPKDTPSIPNTPPPVPDDDFNFPEPNSPSHRSTPPSPEPHNFPLGHVTDLMDIDCPNESSYSATSPIPQRPVPEPRYVPRVTIEEVEDDDDDIAGEADGLDDLDGSNDDHDQLEEDECFLDDLIEEGLQVELEGIGT
ncbi:hypothetical protein VNI00_016901 [Paramarasmius palmivorus]|uniref:Uncharacterized protein n=1 Tax=Paramarasmius palmivorus TaxID=297713 RepID=A0AAW0B9W2_9AGAR